MTFSTDFTGRIIQVVEALDIGDAVSNQVLALDEMFRSLGLNSLICVKWMHENVASKCLAIEQVGDVGERDVIIYHFAGLAEHTLRWSLEKYCTRIILYHNITPHEFFDENSNLHRFCKEGRRQLAETLGRFHHFWADSQYNLDELIALGAPVARARVIPIVVQAQSEVIDIQKVAGSWLFLGRIAANKGQIELTKAFLEARATNPAAASKLYLVGRYEDGEAYHERLRSLIASHNAERNVILTGKVSEEQKQQLLRESAVMVSFSAHEGFGVPLIEAPLHGTPVVALGGTAVGETMGNGTGVVPSRKAAVALAMRAATDAQLGQELLQQQRINAERFARSAVIERLKEALGQVLPRRAQFKTVSVVICTFNRKADLERCLDYLAFQTNTSFEVVVVDGPSTDGTKELLSGYADRIKLVHNPERNLSVSRNMGADAAAGDIVAYIDDDAIPFADWVDTILREFNRRPLTTAGLGGPTYFAGSLRYQVEDVGFNKFAEARPNIPSDEVGKDGWFRSLLGTNTAFSRVHLQNVEGFDEQYDYFLDESDLTFRMQQSGALVGYDPELFLRHEFARSENRLGRHNFNWFSICKNTSYFVALYSGLTGSDLKKYLTERLRAERVVPLDVALKQKQIDKAAHARHVADIWAGMEQGLGDSSGGPRTRPLSKRPPRFKPYPVRTDLPRVGIDGPRLHICIISKEFAPFASGGGIGTLYYHLASELLLLGHKVTVIMPATGAESRYDQGRFAIRYVHAADVDFGDNPPATAANLSWSLNAAAAVAELHEEQFVDVVESALWDAEALAFALIDKPRPPLVVRLVTPFKVAAEMNGWSIPEQTAQEYVAAERALIVRADAVVGISQSIIDTVSQRYELKPDRRWRVEHCGIAYWPFFDWTANYGELTGEQAIGEFVERFSRIVLFVGRLEKRKGIDTLLDAAKQFLSGSHDVGLIIAGQDIDGWEKTARSSLPGKIRSKVLFTGGVSDATREKLISRAYCLVFASRYESFGLVPLEAFVHGVPVVAARAGAIPEVVGDGTSGLLFEPEDAAGLAASVERLIADTALRKRLGEGARRAIRSFSSRNSAIRSVQLYASLLDGERPGPEGKKTWVSDESTAVLA